MARQIKTKTELERDVLMLLRGRADEARRFGEPSRIIVEVHQPSDGRHVRSRTYWDANVIPWTDDREVKADAVLQPGAIVLLTEQEDAKRNGPYVVRRAGLRRLRLKK